MQHRMKKFTMSKQAMSLFFILVFSVMSLCACGEQNHTQTEPSSDLHVQFCSPQCKNQYNVYKSRAKDKD